MFNRKLAGVACAAIFFNVTFAATVKAQDIYQKRPVIAEQLQLRNLDTPTRRLRLHVVPLSDDDGVTGGTDVTPELFAARLAIVNAWYEGTGIQFDFNPATDWQPVSNTAVNRDDGIRAFGNELAAKRPGKILILMRWGSGTNATGNGNAYPPPNSALTPPHVGDVEQNYIALPNQLWGINQSDPFAPHEFGHYLGLYHTFPGWTDRCGPVYTDATCGTSNVKMLSASDVATAIANYAANTANGVGVNSLDGDGLSDTPPDPSPTAYAAYGQDACVNPVLPVSGQDSNGVMRNYTFAPIVSNTMSYFGRCFRTGVAPDNRFTQLQIERMHATLQSDKRRHLIERPCPPDFFGVDAADFQTCFDYWVHRGLWPVTLSADLAGSRVVMAGSFQPGANRPVRTLMTPQQYQDAVDMFFQQGFRPGRVTAMRRGNNTRFTAIWTPIDGQFEARHGLTLEQFNAKWQEKRQQGFLHTDLHIYPTPSGLRVHSVWVKKPYEDYATYYGMTAQQYQQRFNDFWTKGLRVTTFVAYPTGQGMRYAAIWEKKPGAWAHYFGMSGADFQKRYDDFAKQGLRLHQVQVYDGGKRFSAIWTKP